jgi:hypothetical protein
VLLPILEDHYGRALESHDAVCVLEADDSAT